MRALDACGAALGVHPAAAKPFRGRACRHEDWIVFDWSPCRMVGGVWQGAQCAVNPLRLFAAAAVRPRIVARLPPWAPTLQPVGMGWAHHPAEACMHACAACRTPTRLVFAVPRMPVPRHMRLITHAAHLPDRNATMAAPPALHAKSTASGAIARSRASAVGEYLSGACQGLSDTPRLVEASAQMAQMHWALRLLQY